MLGLRNSQNATIVKTKNPIAADPHARPSTPSVKFTPFDSAAMRNTTQIANRTRGNAGMTVTENPAHVMCVSMPV